MRHPTYPLPEGWSDLEIVADTVVADGVELRRAGLCSTGPAGEQMTGSAVDAVVSPVDRGYFELLERVSTVEALRSPKASYEVLTADGTPAGRRSSGDIFPESPEPTRWRYARSNGVALHAGWRQATERALWELAERDRILRAWYGETRAERIDVDIEATPLGRSRSYEWRAYSFPATGACAFSSGVDVVGVFGVPASSAAPLVCGYGARPERAASLEAATREAMQLLGFLWDEPVIDRPPEPAPTPLYHLERFQWAGHRDILRRWLDAGHGWCDRPTVEAIASAPEPSQTVAFVDLTPSWLRGGLRVAKAICEAAEPLVFGASPFAAHLPSELRAHPIG